MKYIEQLSYLNTFLLSEMPQYKGQFKSFSDSENDQRRLLRSLMNVRPPMPLTQEFLTVQDAVLSAETQRKGLVSLDDVRDANKGSSTKMYLWQGDITRLAVDAIVNAANSALLGCFSPCHACIDNVIHSAAGLQLRDDCNTIMQTQGHDEATGMAKITTGYNLPAKYVLHTVGPIIEYQVTPKLCEDLKNSYRSCLALAKQKNLHSVAFCCISTGVFHFPNDMAAQIAVDTVGDFLAHEDTSMEVVFNVFKDIDYKIYKGLLNEY